MPESIGEIPIVISGDFSELEKDINQAEGLAEKGGKEIADAFAQGAAAGADIGDVFTESLKALQETAQETGGKIADAFNVAGSGAREYSSDAEALIEKQKELDAELANAYGTLAEIKNAYEDGAVSADVLARAENDVTDAFAKAHPELKQAVEDEQELEHGLGALTEQLLAFGEALVVTEGLREFGEEALKAYGAIQKTEIALKALSGDTAEGVHRTVEELKAMAVQLGLDSHALEQMQVRLTAFGVEQEKIPAIMRATADAAAATDKEFSAVASSVERLALAGNVQGRQLVQLGLTMEDLAKSMDMVGESDKAIRAAFKDLSVNERIETLTNTLAKFGGVAEEVGKGVTAQWQDVKTRLDDVFEAIGEALAPVIGGVLKTISEDILPAIQHMVEGFNALPAPVREFAVVVGLSVAALAPLATGLAAFGIAVAALEGALPAVTALLATFGVELGAVSLSVVALNTAGIGALIISLGMLGKAFYDLRSAQEGAKKANEDAGASLAKLEIHLRQNGVDIKALSDEYNHGLISQTDYVRGLQRLGMELGNERGVTEDATKAEKEHTLTTKELAEQKRQAAIAAKNAAEAEKNFIDEIGKLHPIMGPLTADQAQYNQYLEEAATAFDHIRTSKDALTDSATLDEYFNSAATAIEGFGSDAQQFDQYMTDAANSVLKVRDATQELADSNTLDQYFKDSEGIVDNVIHQTDQYRVTIKGVGDEWEKTGHRVKTLAQDLSNVISRDLAGALRDVIFNINNIGKDFKKIGADIVDTILNHIIKLALKPLMESLDKILAQIPGLGGLAGIGGGGGGAKSSSGGGGGSAAGGGLGGALGLVGLGVDIAAGITQGVQMAHLNNLMGEVEVSTRGALSQLVSLQGTLNTYLPELPHLVDIWAEIQVTNDILRLMAQNGGSFGGGGTATENGLDPNFAQHIADVINANPSNSGGLAQALSAGTQAANDYAEALQTTASTAYSLNEAVSKTTDSLLALSDATQNPKAIPAMLSSPEVAPLLAAINAPGQFMQGAMLPQVNNPIQYGSIAPVVGGGAVGPGGGATFGNKPTVAIYAVDPNGRALASATQKGLEEIGIRTR